MNSNNTILSVNGLKKYFDTVQGTVHAIDGINFEVKTGETFGLVGESGSGKSTTAYTIIGIHTPTEGEIMYKGEVIASGRRRERPKSIKKEIQIVFQDPGSSLNPRQSIKQILAMPLKVHGIVNRRNRDLEAKVKELLNYVELPEDFMYKYPPELGGGERQSVAVARALATNPSLILLDEPTSSLDVSIQAKIINMLVELQDELDISYLFITHDLSLMRNVSSGVAIMYLGKIFEIAPTAKFFKEPMHPYTNMLISSVPVVSEEEERLKPERFTSTGEIPSPVNVPSGCSYHLRCPDKTGVCNEKEPEMKAVKPDHYVSCHKYS